MQFNTYLENHFQLSEIKKTSIREVILEHKLLSRNGKNDSKLLISLAEEAISNGKADLIALGRGMLYDSRWAWHAAHELGGKASYPNQYARSEPEKWPKAF